jgi:hypothetical protein
MSVILKEHINKTHADEGFAILVLFKIIFKNTYEIILQNVKNKHSIESSCQYYI